MTELAIRSTPGTEFVEVDAGTRIAAVRADGGEVEILGQDAGGGAMRRLRLQPVSQDLGWITPPEDVVWTRFRAADANATCTVQVAPLEPGA